MGRTRKAALIALAVVMFASTPFNVQAGPQGYVFRALAYLDEPAPGGSTFTFDFEPYSINNRGEVAFIADLTAGGEGVFRGRRGNLAKVVQVGEPAPGGGTFDFAGFGHTVINDRGDVIFTFSLVPFTLPLGTNAGVYRYTSATQSLTPIVIPNVTPAPGTTGTFLGAYVHATINNNRDVVFAGIVDTDGKGIGGADTAMGIYISDRQGRMRPVVAPGDPAPGGSTFDFAENPWINEWGDVAFGGHIRSDPCIDFGTPQTDRIFCAESVYLKRANGRIISIAHQGSPAPGGGTYQYAYEPVLSERGDMSFIGDLTVAPDFAKELAVFLYRSGSVVSVARPGDAAPGGGHIASASFLNGEHSVNDDRDVAFSATLDTDVNGDGIPDSGLFVWSGGTLLLVARTGTVIPGVGTVAHLKPPALADLPWTFSGAAINNRGEVFFSAALTDGRGVLLVAKPRY